MPCVIGAYCCAFAIATAPSLSTFSATAALIGAAMFALTSDMAARSGSGSACWASSSSIVIPYIVLSFRSSLDGGQSGACRQPLDDRCGLLRVAAGGADVADERGEARRV